MREPELWESALQDMFWILARTIGWSDGQKSKAVGRDRSTVMRHMQGSARTKNGGTGVAHSNSGFRHSLD